MTISVRTLSSAAAFAFALCPAAAVAQTMPLLSVCNADPKPPACDAVRGDRADGWAAQGRAEVMAQHGMVATSQPLAAQAGLQILMKGGNAIDAAVATAAVLNVVEPMNTGLAGDLLAVIYVAKENKIYSLNASGMGAGGATLAISTRSAIAPTPRISGPAPACRATASCRLQCRALPGVGRRRSSASAS